MWVWDAEQTDPDRFGLLPTKYVPDDDAGKFGALPKHAPGDDGAE